MQRNSSSSSLLTQSLRHFAGVVLVGMALATVFTIWTPGQFSPAELWGQIAAALDMPGESPVAAAPTPTAAPTAVADQPLVGLVSGHKGNDAGAVCPDGLTEAAVNLDIAIRVKAGLEANGFRVELLDEFDKRLEGLRAVALISIHNDSCEDYGPTATGFKVAGALETGAREKSSQLVACLTDRYQSATGLTYHQDTVTRDMTEYHSFYEINGETPAAIIETGFLFLDRAILTGQPERVAQGIIDGVICYARGEPVQAPTP
ncbi:MAG TPA: N-acetylmuramoyl-L-alanine amidase [Anaerolineales bacterium]|nr:N-acetylmuramoyl-L-alanine amidase [Anaerolineales bacterium]